MIKFEPLTDRVVIQKFVAQKEDEPGKILTTHEQLQGDLEKTAGGIFIATDSATPKEKPMMAVVVAVGPEIRQMVVGSKILFLPFTAMETELEGEKYFIIHEKDALVIVKEDA